MREKVYYDTEPSSVEIKHIGEDTTIVFLREGIQEEAYGIPDTNQDQWSANEYILKLKYDPRIEERISKNPSAWMDKVRQEDYDRTALEVRERRNALLAESDKEMVLDRLGVSQPSGSAFSDWLAFLQRISSVMFGEMARYRQELRDITKQEGFPYDVKFPEKPKAK